MRKCFTIQTLVKSHLFISCFIHLNWLKFDYIFLVFKMKISVYFFIVLATLVAPSMAARTVTQEGYDLIKGFEGLSLHQTKTQYFLWFFSIFLLVFVCSRKTIVSQPITQFSSLGRISNWITIQFCVIVKEKRSIILDAVAKCCKKNRRKKVWSDCICQDDPK
jgi:hypothetical protein